MPQKRSRLVRILRVRWRRVLRRLEHVSPAVLAWIPSWGTSLLLHGLAILLLALYLYVRSGDGPREGSFRGTFANQLTEDLTSLYDSDHAGDPFTNLKSPEPPSVLCPGPAPTVRRVDLRRSVLRPRRRVFRVADARSGGRGRSGGQRYSWASPAPGRPPRS